MVRGVSASDMGNEFATKTVTYRGVTYVATELSMKAYDKTVKLATTKDDETGEERFDGTSHNKILVAKCVTVDGKPVDADDLYDKGTRVVRQLQRVVQGLHFDDEPEEEAKASEGEATAEAK